MEKQQFAFGDFVLDADERVLLKAGTPVSITPKVFQLLLVLIKNQGHLVEKQALMDSVWAESFVEESNLTFTIRQLRKALGDDKQNPRFIETVPRRGYRFIADSLPHSTKDGFGNGFPGQLVRNTSTESWRSRPIFFSILIVLLCAVLLSTGVLIWRGGKTVVKDSRVESNERYKFETIASSDTPMTASISPDGKYVAYSRTANGLQSLWLRQLSTGVNTQIIAPEEGVMYQSLEFSADGENIYFSRRLRDGPAHLDRVSILGGMPKINLLNNIDGAFSISPDDRLISFRRYEPQKRSLLIADRDGGNERTIFETAKTITDNTFSPDGKTIAFASGQSDTGERDFGVYTIDLETGNVKPATDSKWLHVRGVAWLPDQSGLLVTAASKPDGPLGLWQISLPSGEIKKIVDTQSGFSSISATSDMSGILLAQVSRSSNLYVATSSEPDIVKPLAEATDGLSWSPDGALVYSSPTGGNRDIWRLNADKISQHQLTTEDSIDFDPDVSPDGRYIVFISDRAGKFNLWRMNTDGSNAVALTNGDGEQQPIFTTDGAFVVYSSMKDASLWKVPTEGGEPTQISGKRVYRISISPDGEKFAHFTKINGKQKIVIKSFKNDEILQEFDTPEGLFAGLGIVWPKDGKALLYAAEDSNSVGNLWKQSLNGSSPEMLTHYTSGEIFYFDFSTDGSELALIRGSWNYDVILLKGFKD